MTSRKLFVVPIIGPVVIVSILPALIFASGLPGLGGHLEVEKNFTSDRYEYLESQNEVRHPHWRNYYQDGETKNYSIPKVVPAEQWSEEACNDLARSKLADTVEQRVEKTSSMEGIVTGMSSYTDLFVEHGVTLNREGEVVTRPEISYWKLVALTPGSISCTVHVDGQTYSNMINVEVEKSRSQYI